MAEEEKPTFILFGKDILKIPCFRNTFLYSISSYFGVGLLTFLATSRPTFSSHVGFSSFIIVSFGYFTNCRINYHNRKLQFNQLSKAMQKASVLEGSEEAELKKKAAILENA